MRWIEGGVTTPKGFRAGSARTGLKKKGLDLTVIECPGTANCAALFTQNAVKAAPVILSQDHLKKRAGRARAVVINSGNANACNGSRGMKDASRVASEAATLLGDAPESILVSSTGVIGRPLDVDKVLAGLGTIIPELADSREAGMLASRAIMTTDTVPKEAALSLNADGGEIVIAGIAKGAGMIHPNLATMICVITTDASIEPEELREITKRAADESFNMATIDRDTSTNDMLLVMASGAGRSPEILKGDRLYNQFEEALTRLCIKLAKDLISDGEGASRLFEVEVSGASTKADARLVARSIAGSNLVKSAVFGCDPNWGRIVAAAGYSGARVDPDCIDISLRTESGKNMEWVRCGCQISEEKNEEAREFFAEENFLIGVDLGLGSHGARAWGCDLSYEYVRINSEYTS
ncbi:MAG: bifunctional glutamate N-acetyltransferase/amino-acid acetyltransferase ArgJ [Theionarchaea archaeon]|nr:bifunctional glutamate N-acetyltransferase/amino-acid acetyltransferase ArgJ [Theionarchaea archaeon]